MIAAYIRKSSEDKNKQVLSIEDQKHECKEIASRNNIVIDEYFIEAKTGWKADARTEFYRMLGQIKSGGIDTIICWNLDRIGRNGADNGAIRDLITHGKLKIYATNTVYDTTNTLQTGFENLINEEFSKKLSDTVKARLKLKAERGDFLNLAPLGYKNTPQRLKGTRVILKDPKRWDLCRKWWELMLSGVYTIEESLQKITEMGLRGKTGKPFSRTKAYAFFRNIFYTGVFEYGGTINPGNHDPMVTMTEWIEVQDILNGKGRKGAYSIGESKEKEFQGMLKCGECKATVTMERRIKHYKNGTTQVFWYYRCTKKKGHCNQPYLNAELFEPQIKDYISRLELNPKFCDWVKRVLKRRNHEEFNFERKQQEIRTKRLAEITDKKENVYGMKTDGLFSEAEYQKRKKELLIEEKQIRESLQTPTTAHWESIIDNTVNFAQSVTKLFEYGDVFTRQMVLKILGSDLILKDKIVKIEAKKAFIFLKGYQEATQSENLWLEPKNMPIVSAKEVTVNSQSLSVPRTGLEPA